jgi:hypothetical protein
MLPFLKHNKEVGTVALPDSVGREHDEDFDSLEAAAEDLCHAIEAKDYKAIAQALRAAHELIDMEPHKEASHEGE